MANGMKWGVGAVAAALALASGCMTRETKSEPVNPARSAEANSAKALEDAHKAQQAALDAQKKDEQAQKSLQDARTKLTQAESAATQAHAQAQQAQAQARAQTQEATKEAQASQQEALQALNTQAQQRNQQSRAFHEAKASQAGAQTISGELVQASANEVVLKTSDQPHLALRVGSGTTATLNGKEVSVSQLPPGAQVRASFDMQDGLYQAKQLQAMSK